MECSIFDPSHPPLNAQNGHIPLLQVVIIWSAWNFLWDVFSPNHKHRKKVGWFRVGRGVNTGKIEKLLLHTLSCDSRRAFLLWRLDESCSRCFEFPFAFSKSSLSFFSEMKSWLKRTEQELRLFLCYVYFSIENFQKIWRPCFWIFPHIQSRCILSKLLRLQAQRPTFNRYFTQYIIMLWCTKSNTYLFLFLFE